MDFLEGLLTEAVINVLVPTLVLVLLSGLIRLFLSDDEKKSKGQDEGLGSWLDIDGDGDSGGDDGGD